MCLSTTKISKVSFFFNVNMNSMVLCVIWRNRNNYKDLFAYVYIHKCFRRELQHMIYDA